MAVYTEPIPVELNDVISPEDWNNYVVENIKHLKETATPAMPAGVVLPYAGGTAPTGYLFCTGGAISRTTFAALFAVVGTTYGAGDGSTTFNLPDLRGRFPLGRDNMGGTAASRVTFLPATELGHAGGAQSHTLTITEMPPHNHGLKNATNTSGGNANTWAGNLTTDAVINSQGSGVPHNNMPPYIALNYIIKF